MNRLSIIFCGLFALLVSLSAAEAITTVTRDFDQLVARADTVFKGEVTTKTSQWVGEGPARHIVTFVSFRVEETYKGQAANEQTLRFLGGTVGSETMEVPDMPRFEVGQKTVLFVVGNGKQFCPLVGIAQGRFQVTKESITGEDRVFTNDGSPLVDTKEIGQSDKAGVPRLKRDAPPSAQAMTAEQFRSEILGQVAALPR